MTGADPSAPAAAEDPVDRVAAELLVRGADGAVPLVVLTDEDLLALADFEEAGLAVRPWLAGRDVDPPLAAGIALRGMYAHGLVHVDADGGYRPRADLAAVLRLRTTAFAVFSATCRLGATTSTVLHYEHPGGMLVEEEISDAGIHVFTVLPRREVPGRVFLLADPSSHARDDGDASDPVTLPVAEFAADPEWVRRIGGTRALTTLTAVAGVGGPEHTARLFVYATEDGVWVMQADDPELRSGDVTLREVSSGALLELVARMYGSSLAEIAPQAGAAPPSG